MNINYWNHIESMAVVDGTQQIFPKNILSLFDFLNLRPVIHIYISLSLIILRSFLIINPNHMKYVGISINFGIVQLPFF